MIKYDTVLVVGAGASMDYGFPSGEQLIGDIIQAPSVKKKIFVALILYKYFKNKPEKTLHDCYRMVEEFISTFKNASPASIDDFLDKNKREEFKIIGKICIVITISRCENSELTTGWFNYLWKKIYEGNDIKNNLSKLTFITFNYDRSLERFLYTRLINLLNLKEEDAIKLFNESVVIHHVYGQLGFFKWQKDCKVVNGYEPLNFGLLRDKLEPFSFIDNEQFANDLNSLSSKLTKEENDYLDKILSIAGEIKTYTEAVEQPHPKISERILSATRIFFLGFGYHKQNLKWLNPEGKEIRAKLAGTTYKFGKAHIENIQKLFRETFLNNQKQVFGHNFYKYFKYENNEYKIQDYFANVLDLE
ncbi:MAG: hypothetical protein Q6358_01935 [Candidatus Brocadiales bacterium]|nr:hypothetical protein [Candidatus Brocadiales bacterium]